MKFQACPFPEIADVLSNPDRFARIKRTDNKIAKIKNPATLHRLKTNQKSDSGYESK